MKKFIKYTFLIGATVALLFAAAINNLKAQSSGSATASFNIAPATASNLLAAPVRVTQIIYTSTNNNTAGFNIIDAPSTTLTNLVAPYTNYTIYQTNLMTFYTNFFGVINTNTNTVLVYLTNSSTLITNTYPVKFTGLAGTNVQQIVQNVSYFFENGVTITNTGAGLFTIQLTYQQR